MKRLGIIVVSLLMAAGCQSGAGKKTAYGAGIGAGAGALLGAVIGHQSGNRDKGALVGAALGGLVGGGIGHRLDKQAQELARIAETRRTERGIITKLKGDILFDSGKSNLKPAAAAKIDQLAAILVKYPEDRINVVGHTDSQGSNELNASLSKKRASAVLNRLNQRGIPSQHLQTEGMGEMQPIASNSSNSGRAMNRRVELEISIDEAAYNKQNK